MASFNEEGEPFSTPATIAGSIFEK